MTNISFEYFWAVDLWPIFILCFSVFYKFPLVGFVAPVKMGWDRACPGMLGSLK